MKLKGTFIIGFSLLMLYGIFLTLQLPDVAGVAVWALIGVLLHDLVWVPVILGTAHVLKKVLAKHPRVILAVQGFFCTLSVILLPTLPIIFSRGNITIEPGMLLPSYLPGVLVSVGVALLVGGYSYFYAKKPLGQETKLEHTKSTPKETNV